MTTYKHILKDGNKVQVDSAIRDGNGLKIDTGYQKVLPTTATAGKVLKSTSTAGTVEWVSPDNSPTQNSNNLVKSSGVYTALSGKQDSLVSGTNIKTINNQSLLGSGNITISGGTSTDVQINGTSIVSSNVANIVTNTAYNVSSNKIATMSDVPSITSTQVSITEVD